MTHAAHVRLRACFNDLRKIFGKLKLLPRIAERRIEDAQQTPLFAERGGAGRAGFRVLLEARAFASVQLAVEIRGHVQTRVRLLEGFVDDELVVHDFFGFAARSLNARDAAFDERRAHRFARAEDAILDRAER